MLKNTDRQQKIIDKKKKEERFFYKYFSFCLIGAIQDTDVRTPRQQKKCNSYVHKYTGVKNVDRKKKHEQIEGETCRYIYI
jgi:hypothetical protein